MRVRFTAFAAVLGLLTLPWMASAQPSVSITLAKTVGTTPGVCAATDNIVVTAGTEVYYCYQATNTGTATLNFHDLGDSALGTLLNDFPFVLAAGASSPQVIVPATPMANVTNTATWTAVSSLAGYTADDTIPYNWQDISSTGTAVTLTDDSVSGALPIGFSFTFFGTGYTSAYASSNGFMTFASGSSNGCCTGQALPNPTAPNNLVAGWWEDLNPSAGGTVHHQTLGSAPNRVFILQFTSVPHYPSDNLVTMQYKLFETTNLIEVHYQAAPSDGGTHSAGIENVDGTAGLSYFSGTTGLTTPLAVRYAPTPVLSATATDTATVTVLTPNIAVNPLSLGSTQLANVTTNLPMTVANTGQGSLTWTIAEEPVRVPPVPARSGDASVAFERVDPSDLKGLSQSGVPQPPSGWHAPEALLYDNGPLVTHPGGGAGGADASALQTALLLGTYGFGNQVTAGNRVADDFTVTGAGWLVQTITFFGYQTGSTTTSTFTALNLRIWNGPPDLGTSSVVFGDTTTNRLASSTWSNMYRVLDTGLTDSARPVMANVATVNTFLPAGTYWLDWQADGTLASGPWAPPISILGQITTGNAMQLTTAWAPLLDTGAQAVQGLPFLVQGLSDCSNPSDVPWLAAAPINGTTAGGASTPVNVALNSTGLAAGAYSARLCVVSNDPDLGPGNGTGLVIVPVTLTVAAGQPSISLTKTVGTVPGVCAAGSNLTVPAGTTVYYCYTVTNTGTVPLITHDLADSQLGAVFTGLAYVLAPGASVSTVAAGLSIPAVINVTTVNTATWSAYFSPTAPAVTAVATATVTVEPSVLEIPTLSPAGLAGLVALLALAAFCLLRSRRRAA